MAHHDSDELIAQFHMAASGALPWGVPFSVGVGEGPDANDIAMKRGVSVNTVRSRVSWAHCLSTPTSSSHPVPCLWSQTRTQASESTPAESAVAVALLADDTLDSLAITLQVRPSTIKTHVARLHEKLGVNSRAGLVAALLRHAEP